MSGDCFRLRSFGDVLVSCVLCAHWVSLLVVVVVGLAADLELAWRGDREQRRRVGCQSAASTATTFSRIIYLGDRVCIQRDIHLEHVCVLWVVVVFDYRCVGGCFQIWPSI